MRGFVFFLAIALTVGGYWWYQVRETGETSVDPAMAGDGLVNDGNVGELPPPAPSELDGLKEQIAREPGPDSDHARVRLATALLREPAPDLPRIHDHLTTVLDHGGASAPRAAVLLLDGVPDANVQLRAASFLRERGPGHDGYPEALARLGREALRSREDSSRIEAWHLLSKAYFASQDAGWRASIRADLDPLVDELIFSPRMSKACVQHTVQSGDTLGRIAKKYGATVESVRWINRLESDLIHPGQRLKLFTGTVSVEIDKSEFRLDVLLDGHYLSSAPVGLGKYDRTPVGTFTIGLKQAQPAWHKKGRAPVPYGHPDNPLGERWMAFVNTPEHQGFGIHGTDEPESIGTESSEGCVRMQNDEVVFLFRLLPSGSKVTIRE